MAEYKYNNKYRIDSIRLKNYDYSQEGYYFVTICTKDKQKYFGNIENEKMILNKIGEVAKKFWLEIPEHFLFVKLDEFVIMPNHIHGIIVIDNNDKLKNIKIDNVETLHCNVSTKENFYSKISPKKYELATIIRSYKSICTKQINKLQKEIFFQWQPRFYERIIRNEKELNNIRQYIFDNLLKWQYDENYF
jgi:putative transposase